jgi:hypothetical protein
MHAQHGLSHLITRTTLTRQGAGGGSRPRTEPSSPRECDGLRDLCCAQRNNEQTRQPRSEEGKIETRGLTVHHPEAGVVGVHVSNAEAGRQEFDGVHTVACVMQRQKTTEMARSKINNKVLSDRDQP